MLAVAQKQTTTCGGWAGRGQGHPLQQKQRLTEFSAKQGRGRFLQGPSTEVRGIGAPPHEANRHRLARSLSLNLNQCPTVMDEHPGRCETFLCFSGVYGFHTLPLLGDHLTSFFFF